MVLGIPSTRVLGKNIEQPIQGKIIHVIGVVEFQLEENHSCNRCGKNFSYKGSLITCIIQTKNIQGLS